MPNNLKVKKRRGKRHKLIVMGSKVNWRLFDSEIGIHWRGGYKHKVKPSLKFNKSN